VDVVTLLVEMFLLKDVVKLSVEVVVDKLVLVVVVVTVCVKLLDVVVVELLVLDVELEAVVVVLVAVWEPIRRLAMVLDLITPPCDMASITNSRFPKARSMNPYSSSCPSGEGVSSDVIPPPPPVTM
jgi:hypothetical protein